MFYRSEYRKQLVFKPQKGQSLTTALPAGLYETDDDLSGNVFLRPLEFNRETYVPLGPAYARLIADAESFFDAGYRERLASHGIKNRRGTLLVGPPGSGKTSLAYYVSALVAERHGAVVIVDPSVYDLKELVPVIQEESPGRAVVVIWDEFETMVSHGDKDVAEWLDGGSVVADHIFTVAITNYPERLPAKLINRPSRFSSVIEVALPTREDRVAYLRARFTISEQLAHSIAAATLTMSIDHTKEAAIQCVVLGKSLEETTALFASYAIAGKE